MCRLLSNRPRGYSLLLIRKQAEAGLLRDGGMTTVQICRYVQELRREAEQEVALRMLKQSPRLLVALVGAEGRPRSVARLWANPRKRA